MRVSYALSFEAYNKLQPPFEAIEPVGRGMRGIEINEPEDFLFERCRINGIPAYRIRPLNLINGGGGHGDHMLEIACSVEIPDVPHGTVVEIELFRDDTDLREPSK
jgi:hypothetical protein